MVVGLSLALSARVWPTLDICSWSQEGWTSGKGGWVDGWFCVGVGSS